MPQRRRRLPSRVTTHAYSSESLPASTLANTGTEPDVDCSLSRHGCDWRVIACHTWRPVLLYRSIAVYTRFQPCLPLRSPEPLVPSAARQLAPQQSVTCVDSGETGYPGRDSFSDRRRDWPRENAGQTADSLKTSYLLKTAYLLKMARLLKITPLLKAV